jgi:uncharacterized repeat protein (TIGR02543 family)
MGVVMKQHFLLALIFLLLSGCDLLSPPETTLIYITYFGNGNDSGTVPVDNNKYENNASVTILDKGTLSKTGYVFLYWNTNPDGTGVSYDPGNYDRIQINNDISLYAIWGLTYAVSFNTNGAEEILPIIGIIIGSRITKPDDPIKDGYSFDAWYKDEQCNESWDFITDFVTDNITLYAKWTISQDEILYQYEVANISHLKLGYDLILSWDNPADSNFYCARVIPGGYEWADSDMLNLSEGASTYHALNYANVEYFIIKTIDKDGNVSDGVKYFTNTSDMPKTYTVSFNVNSGSEIAPIVTL